MNVNMAAPLDSAAVVVLALAVDLGAIML